MSATAMPPPSTSTSTSFSFFLFFSSLSSSNSSSFLTPLLKNPIRRRPLRHVRGLPVQGEKRRGREREKSRMRNNKDDDKPRENDEAAKGRKKLTFISLSLSFLPSAGPRSLQDPIRGPDHPVLGCRVRAVPGRRELAALRAGAGVIFFSQFLTSELLSFLFVCKNFHGFSFLSLM